MVFYSRMYSLSLLVFYSSYKCNLGKHGMELFKSKTATSHHLRSHVPMVPFQFPDSRHSSEITLLLEPVNQKPKSQATSTIVPNTAILVLREVRFILGSSGHVMATMNMKEKFENSFENINFLYLPLLIKFMDLLNINSAPIYIFYYKVEKRKFVSFKPQF